MRGALLALLVLGGAQESRPPQDEAAAAVLARINEHRKGAGVEEVTEEEELSFGCRAHAKYMSENPTVEGAAAHDEDKNLKGYSEEGKTSASKSIVWRTTQRVGPEHNIEGFLATLYHRLPLLHPRLIVVGIGVAPYEKKGKVVVIDIKTIDPLAKVKNLPILYPWPDQTDVPLEFALGGEEWPDPRPDKNSAPGYPITIDTYEAGWTPSEVEGSLHCKGEEVPCWISTPEKPALKEHPQPSTACLLPKEKLKPGTKYTVEFRCKQIGIEYTPEWKKTWSFTTTTKDRK